MILFKKKIVVTGGEGRFASVLKKTKSNYDYLFPSKKNFEYLKCKFNKKIYPKIQTKISFTLRWTVKTYENS